MNNFLTKISRDLRNNMSDAERVLWYFLRKKQFNCKFRRQQPIGNFIVDFACLEAKLVIEIDGGQHFNCDRDKERDKWLNAEGYRVLRFWNNEVLQNKEAVVEKIVKELSPSPCPSPQGRGICDPKGEKR